MGVSSHGMARPSGARSGAGRGEGRVCREIGQAQSGPITMFCHIPHIAVRKIETMPMP